MSTTSARAVIDLDLPGAVISRHLYGHFAEHLGHCIYGGFWVGEDSPVPNVRGIRSDVVEALRAIDIPNLRWPGGCFADYYHWQDGVGPRDERPAMVNSHWGDVVENNHFGTHEFMDLCELLGADAYVNGNVGSGSVQEMSEWVEYLTRADDSPMVRLRRANGRDEPWRVPYWGIGNEAWGCGGNMRPESYADQARIYATYLRDQGDNTLHRIAAGASDDDLVWTEQLMKALTSLDPRDQPSRLFQSVSFHYYSHDGAGINTTDALGFDTDQWYGTMIKSADIDRVIRGHVAVMDAYDPAGGVGLICDEWGTWWNVEEGTNPGFLYQQNSVRDALVAAMHFDIFHAHARRLRMANIAQTINVLQSMILTADDGAMVLTPTYHVFEMNRGHHDAAYLPVRFVDRPRHTHGDVELDLISASASTKDGAALVSLSNLSHDRPATVSVELRGAAATVRRARVLTGEAPDAHNTGARPDAVAPVELTVELTDGVLTVELPPYAFATVELGLA